MIIIAEWQINTFRKSIRFIQFLKHNSYNLIRKKIADYPNPPNHLKEIGFFNKKMLIQTSWEYRQYFDPNNLNDLNREVPPYKENKVTLILDGDDVLIKKKFSGNRKFDDFYSELVCYDKMGRFGFTPDIKYVDYKETSIYMKFIDGVPLSKRRADLKEFVQDKGDIIRVHLKEIVNLLHANGIIFLDLSGRNLIVKENNMYIFDFSDAIYFSELQLKLKPVKRYFLKLVSLENNRVKRSLKALGLPE